MNDGKKATTERMTYLEESGDISWGEIVKDVEKDIRWETGESANRGNSLAVVHGWDSRFEAN